ncbi:MAG: hypothetical protein GY906_31115 [bacterium]|nr:hypothetical protein [bacterium]
MRFGNSDICQRSLTAPSGVVSVQKAHIRLVLGEPATTSLSTLHRFGCPRGARLAPDWRPPLTGWHSYTQGPIGRIQYPSARHEFWVELVEAEFGYYKVLYEKRLALAQLKRVGAFGS